MLTSDKLFPYQRKAINHQCTHPASMLWLDMGLGKLQPNSEPVLTPTGWVQMGNLTVGDFVVGSDGKPTEILGVFPQGLCEIVEITFTDGSSCRVGWEHLWYVQNPNQKKRDQVGHVMTTRQLVDSGLTRPMGNRDDAYWYIPMVQPVHFSPVDLPLDPYLVGVILGDGTITPGGSVTVCTDLEIIAACGLNFLRHHEGGSYCAYGSVLGITEVMRSLGMNGKRSWEKEIPPAYLLGNPEQRIALLQGLLDTDGSPIDKGGVEFSSTSESLADGVVELTQSLGGVAKKSGPRITQHQCGDGRPSWRVNVKLPGYLTPFRLVRKLEKWVRPTKYQPIRKMVSAKVVGNEQSTCIKVAATDSLYVTKNYIVTHNTTITLSSVTYLIHEAKYLKAVIIVAPIRVCRLVWRQEAVKWQHTSHLTFSMIVGTKDQRCRALMKKADVYLVNYENLQWLAEALDTYYLSKKLPLPFDGIVYDEVTKTKNSTTNRVKALNKVLPHFKWATGLTGTPASNGYKDLHGQYLVVDGGVRLGTSKSAFKTRFYKKAGYKDIAYDGTESTIKNLIGDITMEMSAADYNPLPDMIVNTVEVEMDTATREKYEQLEKEYFTKLDNGTEIEVFNAASLTNKCLAEGTEVLTYGGWKRIETLNDADLVWDGVDWVSISGIVYNGYIPVIDCWGVSMTPDHKVLTNDGWVNAEDVTNEQSGKRYDRTAVRTPFSACERGEQDNVWNISTSVVESPLRLWERIFNPRSKSQKHTPSKTKVVRMFSWGDNRNSQHDEHPPVDNLAQHAVTMHLSNGQRLAQLWWAWDQGLYRLGQIIREVLGRYGSSISTPSDIGTQRRERQLFNGELSVGKPSQTSKQHSQQCFHSNANREDNSDSGGKTLQPETNHHLQAEGKRVVGSGPDKAHVFDIINAGPRHRFVVRGKSGEVFIAHNCLQFSNGATYPVPGMPLWEPIHDLKLEALEDIIEEANGQPILCSYAYRSDAERIMHRFREMRPINLTNCHSEKSLNDAMNRWLSGDCRLMIGHAASMGHGVDRLQHAGHTLVWFGLNWSLDLYEQFNARLRRQGQGAPVICHRILCRDTLDQAQALALEGKATTQDSLRKAVKEYRAQKEKLAHGSQTILY